MTTITGRLEDFTRFHQFGFVVGDCGGKAFLHMDVLLKSGFTKDEVRATSVLVVEVVDASQGYKAVRVVSLDGTTGALSKPKMTKAPKPAGESPAVTLSCFINTKLIDHSKKNGRWLYSVRTKTGELVQYIVADDDGLVIRQLGPVTLVEARLAIGKVIAPLVGPTHGVATNDPNQQRMLRDTMKGRSSGGKGGKS